MAEIINKDYKKVKEYDFVCPHCGAMSRFKRYELTFYEDCYDIPCVEFQCPNCMEHVSFPENEINKKDMYEVNEAFSNHLVDTIVKSSVEFHKKCELLASVLTLMVVGMIGLLIWICN